MSVGPTRTVSWSELAAWGKSLTPQPQLTPGESANINIGYLAGLTGKQLAKAVRAHTAGHVVLGFADASRAVFGRIDNRSGVVVDVYRSRRVRVQGQGHCPGLNIEHVWPKSRGLSNSRAEVDLHNLLATDRETNLRRSSLPFGQVERVQWQNETCKIGWDAGGNRVFEPPKALKGAIARILCYVAVTYDLPMSPQQISVVRDWNRRFPVTPNESQRNCLVATLQGKANPFVEHPGLVERLLAA